MPNVYVMLSPGWLLRPGDTPQGCRPSVQAAPQDAPAEPPRTQAAVLGKGSVQAGWHPSVRKSAFQSRIEGWLSGAGRHFLPETLTVGPRGAQKPAWLWVYSAHLSSRTYKHHGGE